MYFIGISITLERSIALPLIFLTEGCLKVHVLEKRSTAVSVGG